MYGAAVIGSTFLNFPTGGIWSNHVGRASRKKWDRAEAVREIARLTQRVAELTDQLESVTLKYATALQELATQVRNGQIPSNEECDFVIEQMRAEIQVAKRG
jgi:hypothetical protein